MSEINIDLLRKDECQPLTNEQMTDIKSQFHPSNTANVNIVAYEIYDEDGEEIVVGEVRKTIDGVKKKKPVYKKSLVYDSKQETINITSLDIDKIVDFTGTYHLGNDLFPINRTATNFNYQAGEWISNKNTLNIFYGSSAGSNITYINIILKYTKDSDTWQPV